MQSSMYNNDKEYQKFVSTLEEPKLSKNACTVLENRYLRRGPDNKPTETIKELFARVAWHLSRPELKYRSNKGAASFAYELYDAMIEGRIMFNSPTLFNAGTGNGLGLSACYVRVPEDSLDSIMQVCTDLALIQKAGGGVGYNFSKLRPKGSMVTTCAATTDGPLPFIDMYCSTTNAIQQGAKRRGAQMGMLDITHPDVWQFIQAKADLTRWQNMNVSLLATNEWMNKLIANPNEYHKVYHEKWGEGYLVLDAATGQYHPVVWDKPVEELAKSESVLTIGQLFYEICRRAWTTGEPGLVFIDRVNEDWMFSVSGINPIEATNPCVTGDTKILTVNGPVSIKDLVDGNCIDCRGIGNLGHDGHSGDDITCDKCNGTGRTDSKPIKLYTWDPDSKLPCIRTGYHPRLTGWQSELLEIEFDSGLKLRCTTNHNLRTFRGDKIQAKDITVGQSVRAFSVSKHRDGHLRAHGWSANRTMHQWVHRMVWEDVNGEIPEGYVIHHKDHNPQNNDISNLELLSAYDHQSEHYDQRFANGFHNAKMNRDLIENNHKVISIKEAGREDVYNITVEDTHTYIIVDPIYKGEGADGIWSGIVSCNCGEQPLENGGNCTLASINLAKYYDSSLITKLNTAKLREDIRLMQHALDNVVEVNTFPVDIVTKQNLKTRRIGGGIMGWADLLFLMGIPYDSEKARNLAADIMALISNESYEISSELGNERGSFLDWDKSDYDVPMRNAYRNTIAPTGTISIISDCSGGVEPIFSLAFTREVLQGANGRRVKMFEGNKIFETKLKEFLDSKCSGEAKNLIEDFVKEIIKHAAINGTLKNYMGVPALWDGWKEFIAPFVTTKDIAPNDHVLMQAAWQAYVDTAISKTINLNNDATVEDVMEAYKLAYTSGCKGITVYRDGSRDGVAGMAQPMKLEKEEPKKEEPKVEVKEKSAFDDIKWEAPTKSILVDDVSQALKVKQVTPMGNLHVTCVLDNTNLPVEIFAQISKAGEQPAADLEAICRLASMYLRETKNFDEVIKQLEHIGSSTLMPSKDGQIKSLPDGLSLALKKIKKALVNSSTQKIDTIKPVSTEKIHVVSTKNDTLYAQVCPVCTKKLVRAEGCLKCDDPVCGFSKC